MMKKGMCEGYSIGIDTFRFVIPKDSLNVFLKKHALFVKIRKSTRNVQIHEYISQKFKSQKTSNPKHPFSVKYINLKRGNKSLSNTILIIHNSISCHLHARKHKKGYEHYVEVVFAGLHQPSKDIEPSIYKPLKAFLKRFKTHSIDMAGDFDYTGSIKTLCKGRLDGYMGVGEKNRSEGDSIYINKTKIPYLKKILIYDKYKKQKFYHKEPISPQWENWKRVEITLELRERFFRYIERDGLDVGINLLNDICGALGVRGIIGLDVYALSNQVRKLKDLRLGIGFKAWAKMPIGCKL